MPFASMHVANTILEKAFAEDVPIVPGKLQRILWFTGREALATDVSYREVLSFNG